MNEYAIKCLESVLKSIKQASIQHANENRRAETLNLIDAYLRTITGHSGLTPDLILWLTNTVYAVYAIGKLDGIREMMSEKDTTT